MIGSVSAMQEKTFNEVKRVSSAGLDGPELLRRVARSLKRSINFDAYCASTTDPATNLITHGIAEGFGQQESGDSGDVFFDRIYFEEDLDQLAAMARQKRAVQLLSESTGGKLDRSLRYRELLKPQGFGFELGSAFLEGGMWGSMDLMRADDAPDFTPRDIELVKRVAPHVGASLKTAALRSQAITAQDAPDLPGVLTLDREGNILSHTPAARRLLEDLEDLHPAWRESKTPIPVRMVAGALKRRLSPTSGAETNLVPRVRVRGRSGRWLTLHGSRAEASNGHPGETVVVIEPSRPEDVAWLNVASYGLSPREEEIVGLVARGYSTRRISETLFISEHTVQRHVTNTFEKVGVRSRRGLLKRLFFDNILPGMMG